jgi:hypothetical protein
MSFEKSQFPSIHSKVSKGWTLAIKTVFSILAVAISLSLIGLIIIILNSSESKIGIELKILTCIVFTSVIGLFVWLLITQLRKKPVQKITQIGVDSLGIHYYSNQDLVRSIKYTQLMPRPENEKYDVFIPFDDSDISLCFYLLDEISDKLKLQALVLDIDFVITNGNSLKKHFIEGIIIFRPDLKIDPGIFDLYKLKKD